ncbi:MAG: diguanylate cyclase [Kangiellaceae bacterium]|nr:diguanylate cyclase [Kangiellaceae bacterium]
MRKPQGIDSVDPQVSELSRDESKNLEYGNVPRSILIVDPDPDFSSTVSDYLKLFGYNICFRTNIDDALLYANGRSLNQSIDVVFLADNFDYNHPIDVLRQFKLALPNSFIAILASRGDDQLAVELLKAGADDYLSRRVKDRDILTSIAGLLERGCSKADKNRFEKVDSDRVDKDKINQQVSDASIAATNDAKESDTASEPTDQVNSAKKIEPPLLDNRYQNSLSDAEETETYEYSELGLPTTATQDTNYKNEHLSSFDQLPGNLIRLDDDFNLVDINSSCLRLLSFSKEDLKKLSIENIIPTKLIAELVAQLNQFSIAERQQNYSIPDNIHSISNQANDLGSPFELVLTGYGNLSIPVRCQISRLKLEFSSKNPDKVEIIDTKRDTWAKEYILSIDDLSKEKATQAELLYRIMWSNMLQGFAHRFINLHLSEFASELSSLVAETAQFFRLDRVSIYLLDKEQSKAKIYLEWLKEGGDSLKQFSKKIEIESSMPEFEYLFANKIQLLEPSKKIIESSMQQNWGLSELYSQVNAQSCLVLPIMSKSKVIGWVSMDHQSEQTKWEQEDTKMLAPLGKLVSRAFELRSKEEQRKVTHQKLSENYGQLSEQAFLDGLTNLANRRYFDKVLESEVRRASREQSNIALLFCDVDYFKAYNDNYGHMEGDRCLKSIANAMQNEFQRAGDFVARFGGEEFAVILSGTLADDAFDSAEKLRKRIFEMEIEHRASPIGQVAMSIGISSIIAPEPNDSKKLLSKADKALYKAKNRGRNRVEISAFSPR